MALVFVSYSPKNSAFAATCGIKSSSLTSSSSVTKYGRGDDESVGDEAVIWWTVFIFRAFCGLALFSTGMAIYIMFSPPDENTFLGVPSVIMLQVGLFGPPGSFREHLNRTAQTAHKCKKDGLAYILTETPLAILRHPNYCISGYSSVEEKRNMEDCEKQFRRISMEERGKFVEEARVNLNNINERCTSSQKSTGLNNEYIVITIVVVAKGEYILPTITSREDLQEALKVLGSIPMNKLMAVEVLWSPREENATLTKQKMLKDYPLLRRFSC